MKHNTVIFKKKYGKKIFEKLSTFYDKEEIDEWSRKACKDINEIFNKYKIYEFKVNEKSYMGIVISCKSEIYGDIFVKIVPPILERYEKEVGTLQLLPKSLTCKFYEFDYEKNAIIMEKIFPGDLVEFYNNKDNLLELFKTLQNNKIEINEEIKEKYKEFSEIVEKDYLISKNIKHEFREVDILYSNCLKSYNNICKDRDKYLLHGDIYTNNMILSRNGIKLIDPLGFRAPFVLELVSICSYKLLYNDTGKNYQEILNDFIHFFSNFADEKLYKEAIFCQLVKVFIPSIYEANDGGIRANKWLNIIKELYPNKLVEESEEYK